MGVHPNETIRFGASQAKGPACCGASTSIAKFGSNTSFELARDRVQSTSICALSPNAWRTQTSPDTLRPCVFLYNPTLPPPGGVPHATPPRDSRNKNDAPTNVLSNNLPCH